MKKLILVFVIVCGLCYYFLGTKKDKPVLIVGMECDYAPNNWEEKRPTDSNMPLINHEGFYAEGYDLQIAKLVADELGYNLKVKKIGWNDLIDSLLNREIDAIFSGMLDTDERKQRIAFTNTYEISRTEYAVVVNTESKYADAKTFRDLYGIKMVGQRGTNLDSCIDQIPGAIREKPVETVSEMLTSLLTGKVDGIIINYDTGESYCHAYKNLRLIRFPEGEGFVLGFNGICAGLRKKDKVLLEKINNVLGGLSKRQRQKIMDHTILRVWENQ